MYESGKPKRKHKPQPRYLSIVILLLVTIIAIMGGFIVLIFTGYDMDGNWGPPELTSTALVRANERLEMLLSGTEWAATAHPDRNIPTDNLPCTWHTTTRADPNGLTLDVQQKLDQALLPAEVRAMVYLTGDECLAEGEIENPHFFPRRTDFYLLVKTDDRYLNADIENDSSTRAQLGLLVRQILNVLEDHFAPETTEGSEPGIITMTFMNGDVVRSAAFTQDELAISPTTITKSARL